MAIAQAIMLVRCKRKTKPKGLNKKDSTISYKEMKEAEYDKLADMVRNHLDIDMIKKIIGI